MLISYDLNELLAVEWPGKPPDWDAFWRTTFTATLADVAMRRVDEVGQEGAWRVHDVAYRSLGGFVVGGWLLLPAEGDVRRLFVVSHGYGGRQGPDTLFPFMDAAVLFPCARGFDRSARDDLPAGAAWHVLHGIADQENYLHRFCVADLWAAASVLQELFPSVAEELFFMGGSFGGGIGAMALAVDRRFRRACLEVPSFGHHPLRVTIPCVGSGEAVRIYYRRHPEILDVLQYFDAAVAATEIRCPVLCANALADPAVPPPGQFAVYNALACEKELVVLGAGHVDYAEGDTERQALSVSVKRWFGEGV